MRQHAGGCGYMLTTESLGPRSRLPAPTGGGDALRDEEILRDSPRRSQRLRGSGVMLGRGAVVFRGMLMMLGGFQVMFFTFFRHGSLFLEITDLRLRIRTPHELPITRR